MEREWAVAVEVIRQVRRERPADGVLRQVLREHRNGPVRARLVRDAVFQYFRWWGVLNQERSLRGQLREAEKWEREVRSGERELSEAELEKIVPEWIRDWVDVSPAWLRSLQSEPLLWVRFRRAWWDRVQGLSNDFEAQPNSPSPGAYVYRGQSDLFRTEAFQQGAFEIQDVSSQWVSALCDPQPGETWWDACAGEGGKFLDLADRMANRGTIWVTDRSRRRLQRLKQRAARAQVFNYRQREADLTLGQPFKVAFDGVLVDAPCSGIGTWQRNPDARWSLEPHDIEELVGVQRVLLQQAAQRVKPGGKLCYAVCTLSRAETSEMVAWAERELPELVPCELPASPEPAHAEMAEKTPPHCRWYWPQDTGGNGMFVALWRRGEA